jgi:hypothetical protein
MKMIIKIKKKGLTKKLRLHDMMKEVGQPMTTIEIYQMYNEAYPRWGYTMQELANVLSKTPLFDKVGYLYDASRNETSDAFVLKRYNSRMYCVWDVVYFTGLVKI